MFYLLTYLLTFFTKKITADSFDVLKSIQVMCEMPQNIKQIANIGGGGRISGWEGCRKNLGIEGLNFIFYKNNI